MGIPFRQLLLWLCRQGQHQIEESIERPRLGIAVSAVLSAFNASGRCVCATLMAAVHGVTHERTRARTALELVTIKHWEVFSMYSAAPLTSECEAIIYVHAHIAQCKAG